MRGTIGEIKLVLFDFSKIEANFFRFLRSDNGAGVSSFIILFTFLLVLCIPNFFSTQDHTLIVAGSDLRVECCFQGQLYGRVTSRQHLLVFCNEMSAMIIIYT